MKPTKKRNNNSNKNPKQIGNGTPTPKTVDNNNAIKKRNQIGEDAPTSKIHAFFKSAPKSFVMNDDYQSKKIPATSNSKDFYIEILKKKLQGTSNESASEDVHEEDGTEELVQLNGFGLVDNACGIVEQQVERNGNVLGKCPGGDGPKVACSECERYRKESEQYREERDYFEKKYKEMKKMYIKLSVNHSELDSKHKDLQKAASGKSKGNDNNAEVVHAEGDVFTPSELKFLQCMPLDKKKDSTFVLQCLQFLYKSDTSVLVNKSLYGTAGSIEFQEDGTKVHNPAKEPLSPHKVTRIREEFSNRISKCEITSVEYGERIRGPYINKLFASGIKNVSKKK